MAKWYEIKLPPKIKNRQGDYVSYIATGNKTGKEQKMMNAACYHAHMSKLPQHSFQCVPADKTSILPEREYLLWMQYCHAFGLLPMASTFWHEKGRNYAIIPGKYEMRHRIYTALCCYRWADSMAPLPYTVVHLMEAKPELHFFQALHYAMGKFVVNCGHGFVNIQSQAMSLYAGFAGKGKKDVKNPRLDLVYGLAMKLFYHFDEKGVCPAVTYEKHHQTYSAIDAYFDSLKISLKVKNHVDLLADKWTPFYYFDHVDKKAWKEYYDETMNPKKPEGESEKVAA